MGEYVTAKPRAATLRPAAMLFSQSSQVLAAPMARTRAIVERRRQSVAVGLDDACTVLNGRGRT
ncbi:hypothetical protein AERO9AM_70213 [Aeromicrobium sp. 9AM]|nr:hypothetical protein AERO9AM_70213 [Aeromicrobium sp. 9AM]